MLYQIINSLDESCICHWTSTAPPVRPSKSLSRVTLSEASLCYCKLASLLCHSSTLGLVRSFRCRDPTRVSTLISCGLLWTWTLFSLYRIKSVERYSLLSFLAVMCAIRFFTFFGLPNLILLRLLNRVIFYRRCNI